MDSLGRFYTEEIFSKLLVNQIKQESPQTILELGVGGGSLIKAAHERWLRAKFYAADIDRRRINTTNVQLPFVNIIYANGLSPDINKKLNINVGSIDVAICNPPYLKLQNENKFQDLFEDALIKDCTNLKVLTSDLIFLAQNLKLLKSKGELGIILPDTLITGHTFKLLRQSLISNHKLTGIIQLPDKVFQKTEAKTHILLIEKGQSTDNNIPIFKACIDGNVEKSILVDADQLIHRMDFDFHNFKNENDTLKNYFNLSDLNIEIKRGNLTHKDLKEKYKNYFHTTNYKDFSNGNIKSSKKIYKKSNLITAQKGDILLARVGKRCIGKVAMVKEGELLISDCIYRIRAPKKFQTKILKALKSIEGQNWLKINAHGVCSQVISKCDLLKFPIYTIPKEKI